MENLAEIITATFISSGCITGLASFFMRTYIGEKVRVAVQSEYDKKLEAFKIEQAGIQMASIEQLRADLRIAAVEREITFRGLQEKRADLIADAYANLWKLQQDAMEYVDSACVDSVSDLEGRMGNALERLYHDLLPNVILLPEQLSNDIIETVNKITDLIETKPPRQRCTSDATDIRAEHLRNQVGDLQGEIQRHMDALRYQFRTLLGEQPGEPTSNDEPD